MKHIALATALVAFLGTQQAIAQSVSAPPADLTTHEATPISKGELALLQLKAGHPDESAKLIRELLFALQLELPADPQYAKEPAQVLASSPQLLKTQFDKIIDKENNDTRLIIYSLIDNTVPKDYPARLKTYCKKVQAASDELRDLQLIAEAAESKITKAADEAGADDQSDSNSTAPSAEALTKLATKNDELATEAWQMPVADLRPTFNLYNLALVASDAKRYDQAEGLAQKALDHANRIAPGYPLVARIERTLKYIQAQQSKSNNQ